MPENLNASVAGELTPLQLGELRGRCAFCGSLWVGRGRFDLWGVAIAICPDCISAAVELCTDAGVFYGLGCVHLMAMELEDCIGGGHHLGGLLHVLRRRFAAGFFRASCPCPTCCGVRAGLPGVSRVSNKAPVKGSVWDHATLPTSSLRMMPKDKKFVGSDGVPWCVGEVLLDRRVELAAQTERLPVAGPVSAAAVPHGPGSWTYVGGRQEYCFVNHKEREVLDKLARAYWADVAELGETGAWFAGEHYLSGDRPSQSHLRDLARRRKLCEEFPIVSPAGYYDGPDWVHPDTGECFALPEVTL
jgi:hypothetical protein